MLVLDGLYYSKDHEWVKVDGDIAYIGITDQAQHELGDVVFLELPEPGDEFNAGDSIGVVESVKAASDIYTPVSGRVVEVNTDLTNNPERVNEDPYGSWMVMLELADHADLDNLMSSEEYEAYCNQEE